MSFWIPAILNSFMNFETHGPAHGPTHGPVHGPTHGPALGPARGPAMAINFREINWKSSGNLFVWRITFAVIRVPDKIGAGVWGTSRNAWYGPLGANLRSFANDKTSCKFETLRWSCAQLPPMNISCEVTHFSRNLEVERRRRLEWSGVACNQA